MCEGNSIEDKIVGRLKDTMSICIKYGPKAQKYIEKITKHNLP